MTTSRGGRPATGSIKWVRDRWHAYVSMPDGSRPLKPLDPKIPFGEKGSEAYERAKASARVASEWFRSNPSVQALAGETVADWFKRFHQHKEGRGLSTVEEMRGRFANWIEPAIGRKTPAAITREDLEAIVRKLDAAS